MALTFSAAGITGVPILSSNGKRSKSTDASKTEGKWSGSQINRPTPWHNFSTTEYDRPQQSKRGSRYRSDTRNYQ